MEHIDLKNLKKAGDADNAFAMCELENGTMALIGASRVSSFGHNTFTEIMATKGNLKIGDPPNKNRLQISDKFGVRHECLDSFYDRFREAFVSQIKDFVNCINKGVQPDLTIENAAKATLVATALTKSFKENGIVHVDDFNPKNEVLMSVVVKPNSNSTFGVYQRITPENSGWKWLNFEARLMKRGHQWTHQTGTNEMVIVLLGGDFQVSSNRGSWKTINGRKDVFSGIAHTLYLPPNTQFTLTATSNTLDIGYGWCLAEGVLSQNL